MGSRSGRKKRWRHERTMERLRQRVSANPVFQGREVVLTERGEEKLSEALMDFIAPYAEDVDSAQVLVGLGVFAWNAALLPEGTADSAEFEAKLDAAIPNAAKDVKPLLHELIERKRTQFFDICCS
jgi:hypothetical protein